MGTTNCSKLYVSVVAGALAVACLTGCTQMKYTIHLDPSVQSAKLPASTIAVFPVNNLSYEPPRGCMGDAGIAPGSQEEYQNNWNRKIAGTLGGMFPSQKFVFLSEGNGILASGGADVYGITEQSKRAARAQQINQMKSDAPVYESMITSGEMQSLLQPVADSTGAAYAIVFVTPALTGSITTNYNAGPNGGSYSQSTNYTADVQALVWECATGKLLFSSGGWGAGSSQCFLMVPQNMAIDGANSQFKNNLKYLLIRLMKYDAAKRYAAAF
jgi:hypothetical protein